MTGAGRVGRLKFFGLGVAFVAVTVVAFIVLGTVDPVTGEPQANPLVLLVGLAGTWLHYANIVRRLHDCGRSGWLALLSLVPIISAGLGLYLLFTRGDDTPNGYGPPPGFDNGTWAQAKLAEIERLQESARVSGAGVDPTANYLNPDGTFNMDGLAQDQQLRR